MKKLLITAAGALALITNVANADPKPLGLEIGKATISDFEQKFPQATYIDNNLYTSGRMYSLNSREVALEGLQKDVVFIFNRDESLAGVLMTFNKDKFNELNGQLKKKYKKVIKSVIPFVGNKLVKYKDGNSVVELNAPHLSFEMELSYLSDSFIKTINAQIQKNENAKKQQESELLQLSTDGSEYCK